MRIISILVMLQIFLALIGPQNVLAAETNTDETKINFEIKNQIVLVDGKIYGFEKTPITNTKAVYSNPFFIPMLSREEMAREAKLARFKDKLKRAVLPKGQFIINASAYTAAADECGKSDGITASGLRVMEQRTLACPPQFPFGAKIKIEGMGTYVCEDRGGAIKGNHFDIYMQTKKEAFAFGRKNLLAEVIS